MATYYIVKQSPETPEIEVRADKAKIEEVPYTGENGPTAINQLTLYLLNEPVAQITGEAMSWRPVEKDATPRNA